MRFPWSFAHMSTRPFCHTATQLGGGHTPGQPWATVRNLGQGRTMGSLVCPCNASQDLEAAWPGFVPPLRQIGMANREQRITFSQLEVAWDVERPTSSLQLMYPSSLYKKWPPRSSGPRGSSDSTNCQEQGSPTYPLL